MLALNPAELIQVKKQGGAIPGADLRRFILDYTQGSISNETMTDLLTVIYNNGMTSEETFTLTESCLLYTSPSPRDGLLSRMPSSA